LLNSDFRDMLFAFCEEKVEFMIVGAYAVAAHGLPRATGDIDLWIKRSEQNTERVWSALNRFGAPLSNISKTDFEKPDTVVQIGVTPRRIDILTGITGVEFVDAQRQKILIDIEGLKVPVIGVADLVRNKLAVGRPQDIADATRLQELKS
jgi:hypothetical protein